MYLAIEEPCEEIFCVARPSCCETIMFTFSGVEHRATGLRHRLPAAFLHLLQASKVRHRLQAHVICPAIEPLEEITSVAQPSCCGFC
jgi:hypothetical protein